MTRSILIPAAAALCVGGLVLGATPALAATPATSARGGSDASSDTATAGGDALHALQTAGDTAIAHRLTALDAATQRVTAAKEVTDDDRSRILATIASTRAGLTALRTTLDAETTAAAAKKDDAAIVQQYRVYVVVLAQTHVALAADRLTAAALPRLQQAHDRLEAKGADAGGLAAMQADIDAATTALDGLAAHALAVTPDAYNADHTVMTPLRDRLRDAVAAAKEAVSEGRALQRSATPAPTPSSSAS